jgi:hypothetical protein
MQNPSPLDLVADGYLDRLRSLADMTVATALTWCPFSLCLARRRRRLGRVLVGHDHHIAIEDEVVSEEDGQPVAVRDDLEAPREVEVPLFH